MGTVLKVAVAAAVVALVPAYSIAKKPVKPGKPGSGIGAPDLTGKSITFKTKCTETSCTVNNLTLTVENAGDADAKNSRVEFYLSDDATYTTTPDELSPTVDKLVHRQALGTVKAGKFKKRTVGGGLLKKGQTVPTTGKYVIAVLDADNDTSESNELNNVFISEPIP